MARARGLMIIVLLLMLLQPWHGESKARGENASGSRDSRERGLILVKVWCMTIAFATTFLAGLSPYFYRWSGEFLVLGSRFSGGVFLATALEHFLSDANASFKQQTSNPYPFAFVLALFGYLLTMLGDCIVSIVSSRLPLSSVSTGHAPGDTEAASASTMDDEGVSADSKNENRSSNATEGKNVVPAVLITQSSVGDAILLILALCFHSVFEGISIGVAETQHDAWRNLWTVCLHKVFAAVAMGIALLQILPNRPLLSCASYSFLFAASSPLGIALGIIIDSTVQGAPVHWVYAISMSIASGVFMYVAINHLLAKRGDEPPHEIAIKNPLMRFMAVVSGAAVMSAVLIWD